MKPATELRKHLSRIALLSILTLFLIPSTTLVFIGYVHKEWNLQLAHSLTAGLEQEQNLSVDQRLKARQFIEAHPASTLCADTTPEAQSLRHSFCEVYSPLWQFNMAGKFAMGAVAGGLLLLLTVGALGGLAFVNRNAQHVSFNLGWRLLTLGCTVGIIVQGGLLTWLTYWLPAWFLGWFSPTLLALTLVLAAIGMFMGIRTIFRRPSLQNPVEGQLVREEEAPALWLRIKELAAALDTQPPSNLIAGIDCNFFVTEAPLTIKHTVIKGRTLFVSIPLLRLLSTEEADAVLVHELAHFRGGDAASSAALGPKLQQYDLYHEGLRTFQSFGFYYVMGLFRLIFEYALAQDSREREFTADQYASKQISPQAIAQALIKISAYANYRGVIEETLFDSHHALDGQLGIEARIKAGLHDYVTSGQLATAINNAAVPHPFDSHPLMFERIRQLGVDIPESRFAEIILTAQTQHWVNELGTAEQIEGALWAHYEARFAAKHHEWLAYRYEPANAEEEEIVLSYFPDMEISLKDSTSIRITYAGVGLPRQSEILPWSRISNIDLIPETRDTDTLVIHHPPENGSIPESTQMRLTLSGQNGRDELARLLAVYRHRHQQMREHQAGCNTSANPEPDYA